MQARQRQRPRVAVLAVMVLAVMALQVVVDGKTSEPRRRLNGYYCGGGGPAAVVLRRAAPANDAASSSSSSSSSAFTVDANGGVPIPVGAPPAPNPHLAAAISRARAADVGRASVCPGDPAFEPAPPSRTTCRFFTKTKTGDRFMCTAWFVSPSLMVTAGHCIGSERGYQLDESDPGLVCCGFESGSTCRESAAWRITGWVTTDGLLAGVWCG
jgi:hypothetical protein